MTSQLIAQGAEAKIFLVTTSENKDKDKVSNSLRVNLRSGGRETRETSSTTKKGTHDSNILREMTINEKETSHIPQKFILKSRIPKSYRHPILDEQIRTRRTRSESKILQKASSLNINVPKVIKTNKFDIEIEFIEGEKLAEKLNSYDTKKQFLTMKKLGEQTSLLHDTNIIHGDLTTSNTILRNNEVFIIDFGLSFFSQKIEDKAVDLHLIKQALEAKHYQNHQELFENFLEGYSPIEKEKIIQRLKTVENRGRYKSH